MAGALSGSAATNWNIFSPTATSSAFVTVPSDIAGGPSFWGLILTVTGTRTVFSDPDGPLIALMLNA